MTVWRITSERHRDDAFYGTGSETFGGRFNSAGRKLVYCAGSISLALLEMLVQADRWQRLADHYCISATFDDALIEVAAGDALPSGWDARPYKRTSQAFGDQWLDEARSLALSVPSIVNPYEQNVLINPLHSDFRDVEIGSPFPVPFDPRLMKRS